MFLLVAKNVDDEPPGNIVDPEHGLRCMDCSRVINIGDLYWERPLGMVGATVSVEFICAPCGDPGTGWAG